MMAYILMMAYKKFLWLHPDVIVYLQNSCSYTIK